MSDFLTSLITNEQGASGLRPRLASRFETAVPVNPPPELEVEAQTVERPNATRHPDPEPPLARPTLPSTLSPETPTFPELHNERAAHRDPPIARDGRDIYHPSEKEVVLQPVPQPPVLVPPRQLVTAPRADPAPEPDKPEKLEPLQNPLIPSPYIQEARVERLRETQRHILVAQPQNPPRAEAKPVTAEPTPTLLAAVERGRLEPVKPIFSPVVPETGRTDPTPTPEPTVQVTIGRIEIRAVSEAKAPQRAAKPMGVMSLEEYMERRRAG